MFDTPTPEINDEKENILYVLQGTLQKGLDEKALQPQMEAFVKYMVEVRKDDHFIWGGVLSPDDLMVIFEAKDDKEAEKIAQKNPFLQLSEVVKFSPPRKWYMIFT